MKAIILAAGKGSKLNPFSNTRPIPMISVAGKALLDNSLFQLKKAGINDVYIIVGHHKEMIQDFVAEKSDSGMNIHCLEQKNNGGIGDAVLTVKEKISPGEYFLLIYGDTLTDENIYSKTQQSFHSFKCPVASICLPPSNESFGNVFLNAQMKINKIVEKPKGNNFGNYVLSGVFVLPESFFGLLEKNKRSMEKALKALVQEGELMASMWENEWLDIVYPCEILDDSHKIGNIRDFDLDFKKLWLSQKAKKEVNFIRKTKCFCTHECFNSVNILFNPKNYLEIIKKSNLI